MKAIIDEILKWPVIVQGALGSALFWLILTLGSKLVNQLVYLLRGFSRRQRIEIVQSEILRYRATTTHDSALSARSFIVLVYFALHHLVKALAVVCLGFIFEPVDSIFRTIGFVMALYYLLLAANELRDTKSGIDKNKRLKELDDELAKLQSKS